MAGLLSIDEALACILDHSGGVLPEETVAVGDATGRVLSAPARASVDLPPFPSSAMDGFAVRAGDVPGELPVAFRIAAGERDERPLDTGSAAGISTGGRVPDGADTVVPVELADDRGELVVLTGAATRGQHVRPRGGDVRAGDLVVPAGERVRAAQVGSLLAVGVAEVRCASKPRVAVLATGSELVEAGRPLESGQIYESNRRMLAAVLERAGAIVEVLPVVADDLAAHREAIGRGLEADVLVTSGGVSMGEHDLVRSVEAELGVREVFWGVAVKPGKPLSFGVRGDTLVFGLPGNPVSSLVSALVFVTPALLALQGAAEPRPRYASGVSAEALARNPQRDEFLRASRRDDDGAVILEPIRGQESHMIARAASADALVHVPRGDGAVPAGATVRYLPLD